MENRKGQFGSPHSQDKTQPSPHTPLRGLSGSAEEGRGQSPQPAPLGTSFWFSLDPSLGQDAARQLVMCGGWCPFSPEGYLQ